MARRVFQGECLVCDSAMDKAHMTRHLAKCLGTSGAAGGKVGAKKGPVKHFHLVVESASMPDYWIHLLVPVSAGLDVLDGFLRQLWLECCGHMSAFQIDGRSYSVSPDGGFDDEDMSAELGQVLSRGSTFGHEYDFGSTTALKGRVVAEVVAVTDRRKPIRLLARNHPPAIACQSCGAPAHKVCVECMWSGSGWLCRQCAKRHDCGEEMLLPVVNSPRVGVCGYTGPG